MRVTCPDCGGPHPKWDCRASAKQIATHRASKASPRGEQATGAGHPEQSRLTAPVAKKSTAAREGRAPRGRGTEQGGMQMTKAEGSTPDAVGPRSAAGTQAPPVDTPKRGRGRPLTGAAKSKRADEMREYMRTYRDRKRAEKAAGK